MITRRFQARSTRAVATRLAVALGVMASPGVGRCASGDTPQSETLVSVGPELVGEPVTPYVFDGDLRDLPPAPEWRVGDPIKMIPRRQYPTPDQTIVPIKSTQPDPLIDLQRAYGRTTRAFSPPTVSVQGLGFSGVFPPDSAGDVGPNHYIQSINGSGGALFRVFDKSGNPLTASIAMDSLFTGAGSCATGLGDPIVLFDELANRWLISEFSNTGNNLCVYISRTADPVAGGWFAYGFRPSNSFPDYPKYSVWPDAYYVTANQAVGAGRPIHALDRAQMLLGLPATTQTFSVANIQAFGFQALTPADHDGATAPPANSAAYFARHRDDENSPPATNGTDKIELWSLRINWAIPASSVLTQLPTVLVSEFDSALCGLVTFSCIPQPAGTPLDPLREVIMYRLQYRNMGTHEVLVGNLTTDVGDFADHAGVRWFELRKVGAGPWTLFQEGTYSPNATHHWMGAISMDSVGNIALAYSISNNSNVRPGIAYTGRLATDAPGVMTQPEFVTRAGTGTQNADRWGDYAALSVDPADGCTFWHTTEYMPGNQWTTWISAFRFDNCPGSASCVASAAATPPGPPAVCAGQTALFDGSSSALSNCSGTINYQWFVDGNTIAGATNPTYTTDPALAAGAHTVDLQVTCSTDQRCFDRLNTAIPLTVVSVTAAASMPVNTFCAGNTGSADAAGSAAVGCSGTLQYQWLVDGTPVAGATNATYTTSPALAAGAHTLDVRVTCSSATSCSDTLNTPIAVTVSPLPTLACGTPLYSGQVGACIPFGLDATSNGTANVWTPVGAGTVTNGSLLNGACFTALTPGVYDVRLMATLGACSTTCTVQVDVATPNCFATSNASPSGPQSVCQGGTVLLDGSSSVISNCTGVTEYQWLQNGTPVGPFSTVATYNTPTSLSPGAYTYDLVVRCSTDTGCTDSLNAPVAVTIVALPSAVSVLKAVKLPTIADVTFSWNLAPAGFFRVNSVDVKTSLPARRATGGVERCVTADGVTLTCPHPAAVPGAPVDVLYYSVVGVCADNPAVEGP